MPPLCTLHQVWKIMRRTIQMFTDIFSDPDDSTRLPLFKLRLCLDGNQLMFEPEIEEVVKTVTNVVVCTTNALQSVPTIQVWG